MRAGPGMWGDHGGRSGARYAASGTGMESKTFHTPSGMLNAAGVTRSRLERLLGCLAQVLLVDAVAAAWSPTTQPARTCASAAPAGCHALS